MMRYIRWQGALAFIAIFATALACAYLLAGPIAKSLIEKYGADYTGAEVNVAKVDVQLMPLALDIYGLQATDPKTPENNMASFDQATASIDAWQLIFGRTIIENLEIEALAFGEQRASAGEVYRVPEDDKQAGNANWGQDIQQNLPDPKALLNDANLKTVKRAKALETSYAEEKENLASLKQQLPDKAKLKVYEQRLKALSKMKVKNLADLEKVKQEFDQLKAEFKQEKTKLKAVKEQVLASKQRLSADVTALKNAPEEDWQDISNKYQLSSIEAEDFAHMLFGEKAREYTQWAEIIFQYVKPMLANSKKSDEQSATVVTTGGRFVHFDEENPLSSFWLKNGKVSLKLADAKYQVKLSDITLQHWMINKESLITVDADNAEKLGLLAATSSFSLDANNLLTALGDWSLNQFPLDNIDIQKSENFQLSLVHALLKVVGQFNVNNGQLNFDSDFGLSDNSFSGDAKSSMAKAVIDALSNTEKLNFNLTAAGDWLDPNWQVKSELDNLLAGVANSQLSGKMADFKAKFQTGLSDKMDDSLSLGEGQLTEALDLEALTTDSDKAFDNLMKNDVVKQQKKKLEDKAKDKLKDKLGDLFG